MLTWWLLLIIILICVISPLVIIKSYIHFSSGWNHSPVCLIGKTTIVTGSNIGIGYFTALDFAKRGARVILACRNLTKAEEAKEKIISGTGNRNVIVKALDLSCLSSVRQFVADVHKTESRLDVLVNNAGVAFFDHCYTNDGLSLIMQTNHFGPFLLTILLLDLLKKSAPSRIVTVSSISAGFAKININDLNGTSIIMTKLLDYAKTKLCNMLFTIKLAEALERTGVTANVLHPGCVRTDIVKDGPCTFAKLFGLIMNLLFKDPISGSQTSTYVSVANELNNVSGKYFIDCKETSFPFSARNRNLAQMLWNKSVEYVKLTPDEIKHLIKQDLIL